MFLNIFIFLFYQIDLSQFFCNNSQMAKSKKYSKKRPFWQYLIFYTVLGILTFGFLISLGFVKSWEAYDQQTIQEIIYFE